MYQDIDAPVDFYFYSICTIFRKKNISAIHIHLPKFTPYMGVAVFLQLIET